ncbi:hypothetical protein FEM48_Zijuj09G0227900 [Ziziphus jujuba var. spinosa]|uniref:U5 small nuclear ribonucleoprotein TSSC4 n=1 Tax=Ziziphus jujuba var. spinosa TaxID=714518 RepID=A0A978UVR9_ZIZJJ|nr:hypothetical protein FEM48_Zijuj09G0227900 [Ziziphus jujuba var. spinosa]
MEDTFRVRVDKIFGSLTSSSAIPSRSVSSLWCLTDEEIERREWNRDKESPEPQPDPGTYPSFLENCGKGFVRDSKDDYDVEVEKDLEDLDDDVEDDDLQQLGGSSSKSGKPDDYGEEEWEIKSSIGLDCTLDYEEEEDEYDKVAVGEEKPQDGLYMTEINDYEVDIESDNMLPNSFHEVVKDPRANHLAAKIRLKEDAEAAKRIDSLSVSDKAAPANIQTETNSSENGINPKSILKRKDNQLDSKSQKRVRFDPECKDNSGMESDPEGAKGIIMERTSTEVAGDHPSGVPDYLRNPSKYTHYTFDSCSDMDEESNKQAYMDFLKLLKKDNMESPPQDPADLSKAVKFIPRKRTGDARMVEACTEIVPKDTVHRRGMPISIAGADGDVCAMEEDEPEMAAEGRDRQKTGRQYRTKGRSELQE